MSTGGYSVFDLDGTLSSSTWRRPLVESSSRQWEAFFHLAVVDQPVPNAVAMLTADHRAGRAIIIVSGRPARYEPAARAWLNMHSIYFDELFMRADDDYRPDAVVKQDMASRLTENWGRPSKVVEDRRELDAVWREWGFRVIQVADPGLRPDALMLRRLLAPPFSPRTGLLEG